MAVPAILAVIYMVAFASLAVQAAGLLGAHGISPAHDFFDRVGASGPRGIVRYWAVPSLFWWNSTDMVLAGACWAGVVLSAILFAGYLERLALVLLYVLYLSFSLAGQEFLSFQWDALLLETGFLADLLRTLGRHAEDHRVAVSMAGVPSVFLVRIREALERRPELARLERAGFPLLDAAAADHRRLVCRQAAALVPACLDVSVLAVELGAPFLIFAPRRIRLFGAGLLLGLEALIFATGNYTFFNLLAVAITLFLFDDQALRGLVWRPRRFANGDRSRTLQANSGSNGAAARDPADSAAGSGADLRERRSAAA